MKLRLFSLFLLFTVTPAGFAADEIHWTVTGSNAVTFDWRGTSTENIIRYGTASGSYTQAVEAATPTPLPFSSNGPFWEAKLNNLAEDTLYHYAIGNGPDRTFRTPPTRGSSNFTVYVEGDIGDTASYPNVGPVQDLIAQGAPDLVLVVGDLTYADSHGWTAVDQHFNDVMVWSQKAAYMPAWGNHEWGNSGDPYPDDLRNYKGRFDFPNPQISPGSPTCSPACTGEDWYWFDYGNVRFITYPEPWSGAWSDWQTKAKSLMDQAQANTAIKFIVTFGHRPAYSSGHSSGSSTLKTILDGLGDGHSKYVLNLNGDSHNYERSDPQLTHGVTHITAGTGGASLEQEGSCLWKLCTQPIWSAFRAMRQGPVKLEFTDAGVKGSFICGPAGGGTNDVQCTQGDTVDQFVIGTAVTTYPLTVSKTGTGSGTVASSSPGIDCGTDCSESYTSGTQVTLTATPASGSTFAGWSGACSDTATTCSVTMDQAKTVTASFTSSVTSYVLTVSKTGTGSGTVASSSPGIDCGTDCSESYTSGTQVTLTATPASGSTFAGWSGACSDTATTCSVTMDQAKTVTASFTSSSATSYVLTVSTTGTGSGTVTSSPSGISCGTDCSESYTSGTQVTLTASPDSSSTFAGWSGVCNNKARNCQVTMTQNQTVTASFTNKKN